MRLKKTLAVASRVCLITLGYAVITCGQQNSSPAVYNPYLPGILPGGLDSEIKKSCGRSMSSKVELLKGGTRYRRHTIAGAPRTESAVLQGTGTESVETLGELMLFGQEHASPGRNQACTSCHMPYAGWSGTDPVSEPDDNRVSRNGSLRAGKRTLQRHTYAPFYPVLQYNQEIAYSCGKFLGFTRDRI